TSSTLVPSGAGRRDNAQMSPCWQVDITLRTGSKSVIRSRLQKQTVLQRVSSRDPVFTTQSGAVFPDSTPLCVQFCPASQEPPFPTASEAQGCDPLIHWGKPQHETAELVGNKQTHPSPPPLPMGHSRVEECPALLEEMGSRAHVVVGPLGDGLASFVRALPGRVPRGATQSPGTLRRVPTPGLARGWDPGSAVPGDVMCLDLVVIMRGS
ncbi:hypothetical protein CRENBAI_011220, partial [Crenichthys baileyi]